MAVEILMPRLSDSMEEGTILAWLVSEGDQYEAGQPLVEIETDKANVVYEADSSGVIVALTVAEGANVPVGAPIAVIGAAGEQIPEEDASAIAGGAAAGTAASGAGAGAVASRAAADAVATGAGAGSVTGGAIVGSAGGTRSGRPKASPLARRLAAELDIDLTGLAGSGPQGRVIRADVDRVISLRNGGGAAGAGEPEPTAPDSIAADSVASAKGESELHELTRLQRTVARRMAESRATVPDIELRTEVDMGNAVELRERLREVADPAPSLNDLIVKAAALALREFPKVNGAYRDASLETYSRVNVGIAVAAEDALVVPTIFDADRKSIGEIAAATRTLAARVRAGSISPAELGGGTFTVSNLGMYGVDSFSAVINPPQSAILAVGALKRRPVVTESGELVASPTIILTLACDHRIIYGVDAARFLGRVRELLEKPHALLL